MCTPTISGNSGRVAQIYLIFPESITAFLN